MKYITPSGASPSSITGVVLIAALFLRTFALFPVGIQTKTGWIIWNFLGLLLHLWLNIGEENQVICKVQGPYAPHGSRKLRKWSRRSKSVLPWFQIQWNFWQRRMYSRSTGEVNSNRVTSSLLRKRTRLPTHAHEVRALTFEVTDNFGSNVVLPCGAYGPRSWSWVQGVHGSLFPSELWMSQTACRNRQGGGTYSCLSRFIPEIH